MTAKTQRKLSWHFVVDDDLGPCIMIREETGKVKVRSKDDWYSLEVNRAAGRAFRLRKLVHSDQEPTLYDVRLAGDRSTCDCVGFEQHGQTHGPCKHILALQGLWEDGELEQVL